MPASSIAHARGAYNVVVKREWSREEQRRALAELAGWRYQEGKLERVFDFPTYADGAAFAGRIFLLAERRRRHPEAVCVLDGRVGVAFASGEEGPSREDVETAALLNLLYDRCSG